MLSSLCCLNTNLCKCSCFGLTRNKNVKIGYIILLLLFSTLLIFTNLAMQDSSK